MRICDCRRADRTVSTSESLGCLTCGGWIVPPRPPRNPNEIEALGRMIDGRTRAFGDEYRWCYRLGWAGRAGEHNGRSSAVSNPTMNTATDTARRLVVSHISLASRLIERSLADLLIAERFVSGAFAAAQPGADEYVPSPFHDRFPPQEAQNEVDLAKAAQRRRHARGEGYGET